MSSPGPLEGNPFEGLPIFGDLAKLFTSTGPVNWEVARQVAVWVATEGASEPNVDPSERIRVEELGRVAELHVADVTGFAPSGGSPLSIEPATRTRWATDTLTAYGSLLEALATSLGSAAVPSVEAEGLGDMSDLLGSIGQVLGPLLLGMQSGFMVGHLARRAFGQYDLPLPRSGGDGAEKILVVPSNLDAFAADWSLPPDDLRLWVCAEEMTHHVVLSRPHVRQRIDSLVREYMSAFVPNPEALQSKLETVDPTDVESFQQVLGDPEALLGAIQTPAQREILTRLDALTSVVVGYVDHVMDGIGHKLIASHGALAESLRRRRVERGEGDRFVEQLFGLGLGQPQYDRGSRFVHGVVERAGEKALDRLWQSEHLLPTPAEVDAPGLWLARIDLPD